MPARLGSAHGPQIVIDLQPLGLVIERFEFKRQVLCANYLIIGFARKETGQHMRVQSVAALIRAETTPDRQPAKRKIANRIEKLVANEFIFVAQPARIENLVLVNGD